MTICMKYITLLLVCQEGCCHSEESFSGRMTKNLVPHSILLTPIVILNEMKNPGVGRNTYPSSPTPRYIRPSAEGLSMTIHE